MISPPKSWLQFLGSGRFATGEHALGSIQYTEGDVPEKRTVSIDEFLIRDDISKRLARL